MKQCSTCTMLFRADVHKCPKCGSYAVHPFSEDDGSTSRDTSPKGHRKPDATRIKTKPRLRGYIVPQTPTPLQGEKAISKEMLAKLRGEDVEVEVDETPTNDDPRDQRHAALLELEQALGDIGTDATVEIPNPLSAGLDFSSDVFLDDRMDPSIEGPMPELRRDPSVEQKRPKLPQPDGVDIEAFAKVPTKPKVEDLKKRAPKVPPPAPFAPPKQQLEIEEAILEEALTGLDFALRDPNAASVDPSLVMDLKNPLTEEEIELHKSLIVGEREVRTTPRLEQVVHQSKIEISPDLQADRAEDEMRKSVPPALPAAAVPATPQVGPPALPGSDVRDAQVQPALAPPRIGSRLTGVAGALAFGGAAALALVASITAVGGWMSVFAAGVMALGAVRKDLGWKHELLHVIAAGAAVASTQPWALDLAQVGNISFWRTPAAMACVGALVVGLTFVTLAVERSGKRQP